MRDHDRGAVRGLITVGIHSWPCFGCTNCVSVGLYTVRNVYINTKKVKKQGSYFGSSLVVVCHQKNLTNSQKSNY